MAARKQIKGTAKGPTRPPPTAKAEDKKSSKSKWTKKVESKVEDMPGAELFAHVRNGDLLAVAAPLALRKRNAEHLESESEGESPPKDAPVPLKATSSSKRVKPSKSSEITEKKTNQEKKSTRSTQVKGVEREENSERDDHAQPQDDDAPSDKPTSGEVENAAKRKGGAKTTGKKQMTKENGNMKAPTTSKMQTRSRKQKSPSPAGEEVTETMVGDDHVANEDGNTSDGEQDHTDAFLKGFESSESDDPSGDEGFQPGQDVPRIPNIKGAAEKSANGKKNNKEQKQSGVLYIGRIPHGFYEREMRAYFSQFGELTHLRLARNRRTGNSKHYAFVEFASPAVADIAARTMNNYLLFGHILKCHVIPTEQIPANLWKGEGKRNRPVPWNTIERNKLAKPKPRKVWTKKIEVVTKSRQQKAEQLKAIGYDFEMPILKEVGTVGAVKNAVPAAEGAENLAPGTSATSRVFQEVSIPVKEVVVEPAKQDPAKGSKKASKAKGKSQKAGS